MDKIVYQNNQNGRVDIMGPNKNQFELFDNPGVNSQYRSTSYNDAMTGNWDDTILSRAFFSRNNIRIIQNGIRFGVYKMSKGRISVGDQDETNLKIIMRSIFLQYSKNVANNITSQIQRLNTLVLEYCVPDVHNEAVSYLKFKNDVSTLAIPQQRPTYTNVKGNKVLELKNFF